MSIDTHIKFDGVQGEAAHKDHKNEIQVLSWSWGVNNASVTAGGGSGRGKASPQELTFSHLFDKSSPVLAKQCASGKHFKEVVLTARKSGEGQKEFLTVKMKEVFITGISHGGGGEGDIVENVSLSFGDIEYAYKPQDAKGGMGGEVKFGWDTKTTETR